LALVGTLKCKRKMGRLADSDGEMVTETRDSRKRVVPEEARAGAIDVASPIVSAPTRAKRRITSLGYRALS
jgi:hypothetical protein